MIFIILGTQKFQFKRILVEMDKLLKSGEIKEKVIVQSGYTDFQSDDMEIHDYMKQDKFLEVLSAADIIISHGGTGALINSIKLQKKILAFPRLSKYGEHVDNHQEEIVQQFSNLGYIKIGEIEDLSALYKEIETFQIKKYVSNTQNIIDIIERFIG